MKQARFIDLRKAFHTHNYPILLNKISADA